MNDIISILKDQIKIALLAFTLYIIHPLFRYLIKKWYNNVTCNHIKSASMLFKRFWYSVLVVILIIGITIIILYQLGNIETIDDSFVLRVTASVIAVSGAITRGGWDIQTVTGDTVIERIDNIMFKISQLSAVVILIIAFTL